MNIAKRCILILIAVTYGCSQKYDQCTYFSSHYPRIILSQSDVIEAWLDLPVIKKSISSIRKCYPKNTYMGLHNRIEVIEALVAKDGKFLIITELEGVSELILVFEANSRGEVVGAYQGSMAWRGNP